MKLKELAFKYAKDVAEGREITTWELEYLCKKCLNDYEKRQYDEEFPYYFDENALTVYEGLMSLMVYPSGFAEGEPILDHIAPFQAFFITMAFSWRCKDAPYRFRFNNIILYIPRKNGKTFLVGMCFILLMLTEQKNSEFYSICLTKDLAKEVRKAMSQILNASPPLSKHFFVSKSETGKIKCVLNNSFYEPRVAEAGKNNSIRPAVFCADEVGNFKDKDNINAMQSGQRNVLNPIKFQTTTAYAIDNPVFNDDIDYVKKVYKGLIEDERLFAMMYYAPESELWEDIGIERSNPLRIKENYDLIKESRARAEHMTTEREEYLTKSMNYFVPESSAEQFIDVEDVKKCRANEEIDWYGRDVYIGVDLSQTDDNTAVSMVNYDYDEDMFYVKAFAFIPAIGIMHKEKLEHVPYRKYIQQGICHIARGKVDKKCVDYTYIAKFIEKLEDEYGVNILGIGYDPYNANTTVTYLEDECGYECESLKQHSSVLYPATKLLKERILNQQLIYDKNELLEINFANCRSRLDENNNIYVTKKKSIGKIDMVVSIINGIYFWNSEILDGTGGTDSEIIVI